MSAGLDRLIERGLAESGRLGHEMIQRVGDSQLAFYVCRRCLLSFTVGYPMDTTSADRRLELISAPAATTPCSGSGRIAT